MVFRVFSWRVHEPDFAGSWGAIQAGFLGRRSRAGTSSECATTMRAASSTRGPDWLWAGRRGRRGWGRVPRAGSWGEFRSSWAEVQAGFLGRSPQGGNELGARRNYEGREFDSRTRLVVGWAAWLGPSSEGGIMRGVSGFLGRSSSGFSWSESAGAGTSSEHVATMRAASSTRGPDWLWAGRLGWRGWSRVPRAGSWGEFRGSWAEVQAGFLGRSQRGRERVRSVSQRSALPGSAGKGAGCERFGDVVGAGIL